MTRKIITGPQTPNRAGQPATSSDSFLAGQISVCQPADGYRIGTDAVMLAAAINPSRKQARLLDMGAGVGAVALAVRQRLGFGHITAIEKDPFCAQLLAQNIAQNDFTDSLRALAGDITQMPPMLGAVLIRFLPIRLSIMPVINSRSRAAGLWLIMARER